MEHFIDTLIIGAGQGGLATSYYLKQQGREHLIVERCDQAGAAWRDGRWDSFTLVTPNWTFRLPGAEYAGGAPGGYLTRDQVVDVFAGYAQKFGLPLRTGVTVHAIQADEEGRLRVSADGASYVARNVVVATGLFQKPKVPAFAAGMSASIMQLHCSAYRNPAQLPEGGVLVVGSSQSGCQLAQEIHHSGRPVTLSVGSAGRVPRRYRGKDVVEWSMLLGAADRTVDQLPSRRAKFAANPHMAGKVDGGTLNLHQFVRDGIRLVGRLQDVQGTRAVFAADLHENLGKADQFEADLLKHADAYIDKMGLDAPLEHIPLLKDGYAVDAPRELDLQAQGIRSVIWANGYAFDFSMVQFAVFDEDGYPLHKRGVTEQPGLYFVGLPWLYKQKSGLLAGVAEDAAYIAAHMQSREA
jgi:putative flavoprotein involved in K+ transport